MASRGATLGALAGAVDTPVSGPADLLIEDVTHDSRQAGPGIMFVALRGSTHDGHAFVGPAHRAGSPAVCVEDPAAASGIPHIVVEDTRSALPVLADTVHGHPSGRLRLVGVTGTNGKTTVTHLVEAIAGAAGLRTGRVGTVGAMIAGEPIAMERTTPEASDFQRLLARMVAADVDVAVVEASSHGIALGRTAHTSFAVAAFTNLSQDHLDFHGDMETYFSVKRRLFDQAERAVVWVDDAWGRRLTDGLEIPVVTVGFSSGAEIRGVCKHLGFDGTTIEVVSADGGAPLVVPLAGRFNAANALVAAAISRGLGIDWDTIAAGIASVKTVPGRFERVEIGKDFTVVVDYAHTPEGVSASVAAARDILADEGRVLVVVGAGGDRDRAKRPLIGRAAAGADVAVLTSDNPRSENPAEIVAQVAEGAQGHGEVVVEVDRRRAIRRALEAARPGDAILVLGKGHETGQEVGGTVVPFDDRDVIRQEAQGR
jgi:UDP-N-acetylmuramoyl-L-alanyl-D-glutamate--2,6-diaminopimelate ligase